MTEQPGHPDDDEPECPMGSCDGSGWYWDTSDPINDGPEGVLRRCEWCLDRHGKPTGPAPAP